MLDQNNYFSGQELQDLLRTTPEGDNHDMASVLSKLKLSALVGEVEMNSIQEGGDVENLDDYEELKL